jgi:hypothetical protein
MQARMPEPGVQMWQLKVPVAGVCPMTGLDKAENRLLNVYGRLKNSASTSQVSLAPGAALQVQALTQAGNERIAACRG